MNSHELFFPAIDIEDKYKTLIKGGVFFIFTGLFIVVVGFLYFQSEGAYEKDAPRRVLPLVPFVMLSVSFYGWGILRRGLKHKSLFESLSMKGIQFNNTGFSIPTLLLEGSYSDLAFSEDMAAIHIEWDSIDNFIVEPARGSEKNQSPPYYKVTMKDSDDQVHNSCFILRKPFKKDEASLVDAVKAKIGQDRLVFNDQIYA